VILDVSSSDGPNLKVVTEAGAIGGGGSNSVGLGLASARLPKLSDIETVGVPTPILCRKILGARTGLEAIRLITCTRRASFDRIVLITPVGHAFDFECTTEDCWPNMPLNGVVTFNSRWRDASPPQDLIDEGNADTPCRPDLLRAPRDLGRGACESMKCCASDVSESSKRNAQFLRFFGRAPRKRASAFFLTKPQFGRVDFYNCPSAPFLSVCRH
jgi:hypothetical protein